MLCVSNMKSNCKPRYYQSGMWYFHLETKKIVIVHLFDILEWILKPTTKNEKRYIIKDLESNYGIWIPYSIQPLICTNYGCI